MDKEHLDNIEKIINLLDNKPELKKSMLYFFIRFNDMKAEIENFVKAEPYSSESEISNEEELDYEVDENGFHKLK